MAERKLKLPEFGNWEVAAVIIGDVPSYSANRNFLRKLDSSNPRYTGWPVWWDSSGSRDETARPYVIDRSWEALMVTLEEGAYDHVDFWRLDPTGKFYLLRALQDDIGGSGRAPQPLLALDFGLSILRPAEAIAVGLAFARAMGCEPEQTDVTFKFRWTKLHNRRLVSWASPGRYISPSRQAYQDELISDVTVPLHTPDNALAQYVQKVVAPLFEIFDGFELSFEVIEELVQQLVTRRL